MDTLEALGTRRVVAVIRSSGPERALEMAHACIEGGITLIEVTFSFDGAPAVIAGLSENRDVITGAGTVLDTQAAEDALRAGARFIVSPHTDSGIIGTAKAGGAVAVAGAVTSNEIVHAMQAGADLVKVFPAAQLGGAGYIRAIRVPLPGAMVMATGGVNEQNLHTYLSNGTTVVGLGSALFGGDGKAEYGEIVENARRVMSIALSV